MKGKVNNYVAKHSLAINRPKRHRDKKNDYNRKGKNRPSNNEGGFLLLDFLSF